MPNTKSAAKALRQSQKKKLHNLFWKKRIKSTIKSLKSAIETDPKNIDILKKEVTTLQKVLDKAAKNKVIHKNKANRLKSRFAKLISAHEERKTNSKSKSSN